MWPLRRSIGEVFAERRATRCFAPRDAPFAPSLPPMNPTDFSVLLLAWDDADPAVVVLGGSALPPTLPLVYQLAARHPVLAVYPHLPAAATAALEAAASGSSFPEATAPTAAPAAADSAAGASPLDAAADAPGVHLLAPAVVPHSFFTLRPATGSRLVGLDDLLPAIQHPLPTSHSLMLAAGVASGAGNAAALASPLRPGIRSQWPANAGPERAAWQAPAAPYAGAAEAAVAPVAAGAVARGAARVREAFPPPPPRPELLPGTAPASGASAASGAVAETTDAGEIRTAAAAAVSPTAAAISGAAASALTSDVNPAIPLPLDEPVAEPGAAEARDLDAPEDDLVADDAPPAASAATGASTATAAAADADADAAADAAAVATPEPAATWAVRQPTLDGLNFRMIQYARQAAQLVAGRHDFDVIYAPNWPAWLAALEICNHSGQPLVLYVPALASNTAPAAERGWLLGLERMTLRRASLVLVPDTEALRQLRARHAEALGEVRIVPATDETAVQLVLAEVARG